jgi:hypothetical protein
MNTHELTERYVEVWNEPNPVRRRTAIEELWTSDGTHVLQAPPAIAEAAENLGFGPFTLVARGHEAVERRVQRTYEEFVASGDFTFRSRGNANRVGHMVEFVWEMVSAEGHEVAAAGLEILILDQDDRITGDYQCIIER